MGNKQCNILQNYHHSHVFPMSLGFKTYHFYFVPILLLWSTCNAKLPFNVVG